MKLGKFLLWIILLALFLALLIASVGDVFTIVVNSYRRYLWFLGGGILMLIIDRFAKKNNEILKTTHHELTHMFVNLITFRKILMIKVDTHGGAIASLGKKWMLEMVALAPYCLPLAAYVVMLFGVFFANDMNYIFYILLGITYFFHVLCIISDFKSIKIMGRHQTDINQYPLLFSYLYILCFWLFNTMIVLISVRSDIFNAYRFMFNCFKETILSLF